MEQVTKQRQIKKRNFPRLRPQAIIFCVVLIALIVYFVNSYFMNSVRSIKVVGNDFLSDEYIVSLTDIELNKHLYSGVLSFKEKAIEKDIKIDDCEISISNHHEVIIKVKENTIVGLVNDLDNEPKFMLADGSIIKYDLKCVKNPSLIPYVNGYQEDFTPALATRLGLIKAEILTHISDITHISFTYEKNMVKLTMDEGYVVYSSLEGLPYINYYLEIISQDVNSSKGCLLVMEDEQKALIMDCKTLESYRNDLD